MSFPVTFLGSFFQPVLQVTEIHAVQAQVVQAQTTESIDEVAAWTGKKFGELRGHRIIDKNVRILLHTGGFALFFPHELHRKFDHLIPISYPENDQVECWIATKGFAFLKFDIDSENLAPQDKDYASDDLETALLKIEGFVRRNFFSQLRLRGKFQFIF